MLEQWKNYPLLVVDMDVLHDDTILGHH